jgi:ATP-binding cassette subfamily B protein
MILPRFLRRPKLRFVPQMTADDCGAAALAMVMRYHGRLISQVTLREALATRSVGTDLSSLIKAAERFGFSAKAEKLAPEGLPALEPGVILHWRRNHFVVLAEVDGRDAVVLDPVVGRRRLSWEKVAEEYSGFILTLAPLGSFTAETPSPEASTLATLLGKAVVKWNVVPRLVVASLILQSMNILVSLLVGLVADRVLSTSDMRMLRVIGASLLAFVAAYAFGHLTKGWILLRTKYDLDCKLFDLMARHVLKLPITFFVKRHLGDLLGRLNSYTLLREVVGSLAANALMDIVLLTSAIIVLSLLSPPLLVVTVVLLTLQVSIALASRPRRAEILAEQTVTEIRLASCNAEVLGGMDVIKTCGEEQRTLARWSELFAGAVGRNVALGRFDLTITALQASVRLAIGAVTICIGAWLVLRHGMSFGMLMSCVGVASAASSAVGSLVGGLTGWESMKPHLDRFLDLLAAQEDRRGGTNALPQLRGDLAIENLSFKYAPDEPWILKNISLKVDAGSFLAVVGPSGCGKSTLARLLSGLHPPGEGQILIDGVAMDALDLAEWRRRIGIVAQNTQLVGASVREAIAFSDPSATDEQVRAAATLASIHDDILALPMGYDTPLLGGGTTWSGGQRQRLALARALLRRPRFLILDEATSALDSLTERQIDLQIRSLNCTRVVFAHRLSTVMRADQIAVLEKGAIVELGTHEQLLRRKGSYARFASAALGESAGDADGEPRTPREHRNMVNATHRQGDADATRPSEAG